MIPMKSGQLIRNIDADAVVVDGHEWSRDPVTRKCLERVVGFGHPVQVQVAFTATYACLSVLEAETWKRIERTKGRPSGYGRVVHVWRGFVGLVGRAVVGLRN